MSFDKPVASLLTLPIEILHKIFDDLDAATIIWSMKNVCRRFREATEIYPRHTLDLTSVSKPDFRRLVDVVPPETVTALILSKRDTTNREIDVFHSLVNIDLFTRLRSLTLVNIDETSLYRFLHHARRCSLISLSLRSQFTDSEETPKIVEYLSSIIGQSSLVRLEMLTDDLSMLINHLTWPSQSKLRHLTVAWTPQLPMLTILDRLPDLKTLVLNEESVDRYSSYPVSEVGFSTIDSQLTSLKISSSGRLVTRVQSLFAHTPSLTYLKIIGGRHSMIDGFHWEELIKTKLPKLTKFEFHGISRRHQSRGETDVTLLNGIMAAFRTPFWTDKKRWLVICTWHPEDQFIEIYTPLVSTPDYRPSWHPNTMTITNFTRPGEYYRKYEDVLRLQSVSVGRTNSENTVRTDDGTYTSQIDLINSPLFPNVNELSVEMDRFNSLQSVPPGLDLSNVKKLSLSLFSILPDNESMFVGLKSLLRQTPNIDSLEFSGSLFVQMETKTVKEICLVAIEYIDPSKLCSLTIPVIHVSDVRRLLSQFGNILRIKFDLRVIWVDYGEIVKYLRTLQKDYFIEENDPSKFVEMCRRPEATNKSNSIHRRDDPRLFSSRNERNYSPPSWERDLPVERTDHMDIDWNSS